MVLQKSRNRDEEGCNRTIRGVNLEWSLSDQERAAVTKPARREFSCPECKAVVVYDPDDPLHIHEGAMLRKAGAGTKSIVYLTCDTGHVRRYVVD